VKFEREMAEMAREEGGTVDEEHEEHGQGG
jgi:hypothetical protein